MIPSKPFHGSTTEGGVCQLSDKVRELSVISETSEQVSVLVRNIRGGQ